MSDGDSEDGKRASKKRKASRACDRCNVQHQPCDNASPKCSVCERAGTDCTYNRPVRKRGPRTGYTAQYGERLWGLVLQANPAIEDLVLQTLASGTYGDTGVSNVDYFRNNDHQAGLVKRFNESRLGQFVQSGKLPDLETIRSSQTSMPVVAPELSDLNVELKSSQVVSTKGASESRSQRSTICGISKVSPSVNPHGAPQNPGDIYTLSDDFRKRVSYGDAPADRHFNEASSQGMAQTPDWQTLASPRSTNNTAAFTYNSNEFPDNYENLVPARSDSGRILRAETPSQTPHLPHSMGQTAANHGVQLGRQNTDFDFPDINQWYESIPTDTLLNLGFTAGEGMAADFLDLCENPDPVESAPISPSGNDEDEEAVWRRLVMRGRFI
ncbi:hypothetical protein BJ170DRAFT_679916 [Xylariales sp. AK1849]|nr:hypothetical protein BJ170DRAFT_679916 [Xylariales sp. AK1849]